MSTFNNQFHKQLHFNFFATRNSQKQRKSCDSPRASWLRDFDLDVILTKPSSSLQQLLLTKWHELTWYNLEDILNCPVGSRFIVCIAANGGKLEHDD
jgi:hypothetical protein